MTPWMTLLIVVGGWIVVMAAWRLFGAPRLSAGPGGDIATGMMWMLVRAYTYLMHRPSCQGRALIPNTNQPGGMIVIANHTGPIDPVLIQALCPFKIRWMMAQDMMVPQLDTLWRFLQLIPVARDGRDSGPARQALRHVKSGGVIGIFPEGAIPQPRRELRPFLAGAGMIIARTRAPVLLVWISNTPESPEMFTALATRSRARVVFVDKLDFSGERDAETITQALRQRLAEVSGWPFNDEPLPPRHRNPDPFAVA